jgi:hypothetical protein
MKRTPKVEESDIEAALTELIAEGLIDLTIDEDGEAHYVLTKKGRERAERKLQ